MQRIRTQSIFHNRRYESKAFDENSLELSRSVKNSQKSYKDVKMSLDESNYYARGIRKPTDRQRNEMSLTKGDRQRRSMVREYSNQYT